MTTMVFVFVEQPLWHVGHGPGIFVVGVVAQHASLAGTVTYSVVFKMHCATRPHVERGVHSEPVFLVVTVRV